MRESATKQCVGRRDDPHAKWGGMTLSCIFFFFFFCHNDPSRGSRQPVIIISIINSYNSLQGSDYTVGEDPCDILKRL